LRASIVLAYQENFAVILLHGITQIIMGTTVVAHFDLYLGAIGI